MSRQLYGKSVGKGRFSGRGGTCYHNKFFISGLYNLLCNLRNSGLLQSLCNQYQLIGSLSCNLFIQLSYGVRLYHFAPFFRFSLHPENLRSRRKFRHRIRTFPSWKLQHQSSFIGIEFKILQITSMIHHKSVKVVLKISQTVQIHSGHSAETKQFFFIIHTIFMKNFNSFPCADTAF